MDESTQQIIALALVALFIGLELLRRWRRKQQKSAGCDGCKSGTSASKKNEQPLKFYKR